MEITLIVLAFMLIVLSWAVYRLDRKCLSLLEKMQRQDRRINEVLFKVTRERANNQAAKKRKAQTEPKQYADVSAIGGDIVCTKCDRKYPASRERCPYCGTAPSYSR